MPNWTKEQSEAINKTGTNIIVSAGAGSGKTAVLSERVLRILKEGTHIDELLVLTFTKEAAFEMKERIRNKIKENDDLKDELDLIDSSYITTFDSFALSTLKKYHYLMNISSNVKIIDSSIIKLKKDEYIEEIFLKHYKEDEEFKKLISTFCTKDDKEIKDSIISISDKLDLKVEKEKYIDEYIDTYFDESKINRDIILYENLIKTKIEEIKEHIEYLKLELDTNYIEKLYESLNSLLNSNSYDEIKINLNVKLPSLPRGCSDITKNIKENITDLIKEIKDLTNLTKEEIKASILSTKDNVRVILNIIKELDRKISEYKFKYDVYEFNDIAKLSIKILKENEDVRLELKNKFKEILIDEYQDTNDIQEEFINLIENNNVYMVGDIKQSIYRFRNANPYIFKSKYDLYSDNNGGIKIDLNKNFRSREEVLNNINDIFNKVMNDNIGGANYKLSHNMIFGNHSYNTEGKTTHNNDLKILNYDIDSYKKEEIEAFIVAQDIENKVKSKHQVFDKEKKELRDIKYSDFVILMDRTTDFDVYKKVFTYKNIPLIQIKDQKMNDEMDLYVLKNLIKLLIKINKKELDTEFKYLFASLERSFLIDDSDQIIYDYLINETYEESQLYKKSLEIIQNIDNLTPTLLLNKVIKEFDYYDKILKLKDINEITERLNNIKEYASNLEQLGYSIEDYSNYLEELINSEYELKYSLKEDSNNGVKIMTIHKSKGLEYHICYYTGLYKKFNINDLKERFTYDNEFGIIIPYFKEGIGNTIYKTLMKDRYIKEEIGEKIRLFYVALTRAKEQMILVRPISKKELLLTESTMNKYRSFLDILDSLNDDLVKYEEMISEENLLIEDDYKNNKYIDYRSVIPTNNIKIIEKNINCDNETLIENTYSKKQNELIDIEVKKNMLYGKKVHELFELIDLKNPNYELLDSKEKTIISNFLNQELLKNINKAIIYKEYEFIYETDKEYHGIIDLMLEYEDHIDIIDFKLKEINDEAYINQLNGYKEYIKVLTNKKVNTYLYSILNNKINEI